MKKVELLLTVFTLICWPLGNDSLIVEIEDGLLKGQTLESRQGIRYNSFTGIPYAKPPIGELRFKEPKRVLPWNGVLDSTKPPKMCIQTNSYFKNRNDSTVGDEDCLYLNVYAPDVDQTLPVLFWIHGGAFVVGYSGSALYGPEYFMDKNVVLVTANYRLGLLGFLSTEDDTIPGNFGLKDQVMALKWVHRNIRKFGGDPGQVTIAGESAGGASVGYHLLSPLSKGLFHKAIIQSGSPVCNWAVSFPGVAYERAREAAKMFGCTADTSNDVFKCLSSISSTEISNLYTKFYKWINNPIVLFPPIIEKCSPSAFICHNPLIEFKQESFVPVIIGVNSAEGGLLVASMFNETSLLYPELNTDFNRLVSITLMYDHYALPEDIAHIGHKLFNRYFPKGIVENESHLETVNLFGDGCFVYCTMDMAVKLQSPVYFYLFDYQVEFSSNKHYGQCPRYLGVTHGDEIKLLFKRNYKNAKQLNEKDTEMSKKMINLWTKYIETETPTIDGSDDGRIWIKFTSAENSTILYINSVHPELNENYLAEMYKFWEKLPIISRLRHFTFNLNANNHKKNEL